VIQEFLIAAFFTGSALYLGRLLYRSFKKKKVCDSGCGKCGIDLQKIEEELKTKGL
jgi:hypothetical protein